MSYTAEPYEDPREKQDIEDFKAALRAIREASGWGEIVFTLTEGDVSYHDVKVRRVNKRKLVVTKEV